MTQNLGKFFGVGVGPGDPELLTLKAIRIIKNSDVIYVPTKSTIDKSFALSIIKDYILNSEIKPAVFPMSYNEKILAEHREKIVNSIIGDLKEKKIVTFITIGDPMLYSTYAYILELIKEKMPEIPVETIPGISSINILSAKSNIPLAEEDEKIAIYPLTHFNEDEFKKIYENSDTIILMKFPKESKEIIEKIKDFKFKKIVYMKNICKDGEVLRYDLDEKELFLNVKKYFTIVLLKK